MSAPSRMKNLLSELIFLILGGLVACLIVTLGYSVVAVIRIPGFSVPLFSHLCMALLIWGCAVFEYLFHTWLGFQFGRNVSFAVAAAEILFSALMLTGLGETIWFYVPSASERPACQSVVQVLDAGRYAHSTRYAVRHSRSCNGDFDAGSSVCMVSPLGREKKR